MNKNKILILVLAVIGGIALLIAGVYAGVLFQAQEIAPRLEKAQKVMGLTQSKLIDISVKGEVANISDRTLTLSEEEESLAVRVSDEAKISSIAIVPRGVSVEEAPNMLREMPREIGFEEIEVGDVIMAELKVLEDGEYEAAVVLVLLSRKKILEEIFPEGVPEDGFF